MTGLARPPALAAAAFGILNATFVPNATLNLLTQVNTTVTVALL
jgi:hypothetical protein